MDTVLGVVLATGYHKTSKQQMRVRRLFFVSEVDHTQHLFGVMAETWSTTTLGWVISSPHFYSLEECLGYISTWMQVVDLL
jgi:hypothetical protein